MILEFQSTNPDALYVLDSLSPSNRQGGSGYSFSATGAELTTTIAFGHLKSTKLSSATLTIPETNQFTVAFVAKPVGSILAFGGYEVFYDGGISIRYLDVEVGRMELEEHRARMFVISFGPDFLRIDLDDYDGMDIISPEEVLVDELTILADGGLLDMVTAWKKSVSTYVIDKIIDTYDRYLTPFTDKFTPIDIYQTYQRPSFHTVSTGQFFPASEEATGWTVHFSSDSYVVVNGSDVVIGEYIAYYPETMEVEGFASFVEYDSPAVQTELATILPKVAPPANSHPVLRQDNVGAMGGFDVVRNEDAPAIKSISFWMDPADGPIVDNVSMSGGVISGSVLVNGATYSGATLTDRFMLTVNRDFADEFTVEADASYIYLSDAALSAANALELYHSLFIMPKISVPADAIDPVDTDTFVIESAWGIVSTG